MTIFMDIVGSLVVRATMVAIVLSVNITLNNAMYEKSARVILKQNLTTLTDIMRTDIKNLGYNYSGPKIYRSTVSSELGTVDFRFYGDIDNNGTADDIRYQCFSYTTTPSKLWYVTRTVSGVAQEVGRGIDSFKVTLYDGNGNVTTSFTSVRSLKLTVRMKSEIPLSYRDPENERIYPRQLWEMQLFPKSL